MSSGAWIILGVILISILIEVIIYIAQGRKFDEVEELTEKDKFYRSLRHLIEIIIALIIIPVIIKILIVLGIISISFNS